MKRKDKGEQRHDNLISELEEFLVGGYDEIKTFFEYCRNGEVGEVDLLGMVDRLYHKGFHFYEVKCSNGSKQVKKAQSQYDRFKLAYPEKQEIMRGFLYTPNKLIRLNDGNL